MKNNSSKRQEVTRKKCPRCGRLITPNNYKKHIATCDGGFTLRSSNLREYLFRNIIKNNPNCPVCNHKFVTAITKAILQGESYSTILNKYNKYKDQPKLTAQHLSKHKKHLNLDTAAIIERARSTLILDSSKGGTTDYEGNKRFHYMKAIAQAIVDKNKQLDSLVLSQLAKLEITSVLFRQVLSDAREKQTIRPKLAELYLKFQESFDRTQLKLLEIYKGIPNISEANVSVKLLWTLIYSMQRDVLRILVEQIPDMELKHSISTSIGELFDRTNEQLRDIIKEASVTPDNPMEALVDHFESASYTVIETMEDKVPNEEQDIAGQ